jgi:hypothetical protein
MALLRLKPSSQLGHEDWEVLSLRASLVSRQVRSAVPSQLLSQWPDPPAEGISVERRTQVPSLCLAPHELHLKELHLQDGEPPQDRQWVLRPRSGTKGALESQHLI